MDYAAYMAEDVRNLRNIDAKLMVVKTEVANDGGTTASAKSVRLWKNNEAAADLFARVPKTVDGFMKKSGGLSQNRGKRDDPPFLPDSVLPRRDHEAPCKGPVAGRNGAAV